MFTHYPPRQRLKVAESRRPNHSHTRLDLSWRGRLRRFRFIGVEQPLPSLLTAVNQALRPQFLGQQVDLLV
jgi:hypothetical protein